MPIKVAKNKEGSIAGFAGIIIDTERIVIHLPAKKLQKVQLLVQNAIARRSATLLELQKLREYPIFVSNVVPLGRTCLRRLYHMELYFPAGGRYYRRRLSNEARKDLVWWQDILAGEPADRLPHEYEKMSPSGQMPPA